MDGECLNLLKFLISFGLKIIEKILLIKSRKRFLNIRFHKTIKMSKVNKKTEMISKIRKIFYFQEFTLEKTQGLAQINR